MAKWPPPEAAPAGSSHNANDASLLLPVQWQFPARSRSRPGHRRSPSTRLGGSCGCGVRDRYLSGASRGCVLGVRASLADNNGRSRVACALRSVWSRAAWAGRCRNKRSKQARGRIYARRRRLETLATGDVGGGDRRAGASASSGSANERSRSPRTRLDAAGAGSESSPTGARVGRGGEHGRARSCRVGRTCGRRARRCHGARSPHLIRAEVAARLRCSLQTVHERSHRFLSTKLLVTRTAAL
jgi:hypothetical protein